MVCPLELSSPFGAFGEYLSVMRLGQRARRLRVFVLLAVLIAATTAAAQSKHLAPQFETIPRSARIAIMPVDIELFSISAGGIVEPKADWTQSASQHFRAALLERKKKLGAVSIELSEKDVDDLAEINALHAAIARAIALHHFGPRNLSLPTKEGKLDWSLGEAVRPIKEKTGADYALFSWIRDSYASSERVATFILFALIGVIGIPGGAQTGYASLVDLDTGRIVWFNHLERAYGDLREADKAGETLDALLTDFPSAK